MEKKKKVNYLTLGLCIIVVLIGVFIICAFLSWVFTSKAELRSICRDEFKMAEISRDVFQGVPSEYMDYKIYTDSSKDVEITNDAESIKKFINSKAKAYVVGHYISRDGDLVLVEASMFLHKIDSYSDMPYGYITYDLNEASEFAIYDGNTLHSDIYNISNGKSIISSIDIYIPIPLSEN